MEYPTYLRYLLTKPYRRLQTSLQPLIAIGKQNIHTLYTRTAYTFNFTQTSSQPIHRPINPPNKTPPDQTEPPMLRKPMNTLLKHIHHNTRRAHGQLSGHNHTNLSMDVYSLTLACTPNHLKETTNHPNHLLHRAHTTWNAQLHDCSAILGE